MANTSINMSSCFENPQSALISAFKSKDLIGFRYALEHMRADPNIVDSKLDMTIFERVLMTPDSSEFIQACIDSGVDLHAKNKRGRYPLHYVIDSLCPENLRCFMKYYNKSKINVRYANKNCLHILIDLLPNDEKYQEIAECLKILLLAGCDPNMPNEKNRTPFYSLLRIQPKLKNKEELVNFFLDNSKIDIYTYKADDMKKMFAKQLPDLQLPEKIEKSVDLDFMLSLLRSGDETSFENNFSLFKEKSTNNDSKGKFNDPILLYTAVQNHLESALELLVNEETIDLDKQHDSSKSPPIFLAAESGYYKILQLLLSAKKKPQSTYGSKTLLHQVCQNLGIESGINSNVNYEKCLEIVLEKCDIDVNQKDERNSIALHYAVRYQNLKAQKLLLQHQSNIGVKNFYGEMPVDDLNREVFEDFLNDCVSTNVRTKGNEEQEIYIDYKFLVPPVEKNIRNPFFNEIAPLRSIAHNTELRPLILHPVLTSFIYLKWQKLRVIFSANLAIFSVFMLALLTYIVLGQQSVRNNGEDVLPALRTFCYLISIIGIIIMILRELFQVWLSAKLYFKSITNYLEIILIIFAFLILFVVDNNDSSVASRIIRVVTIVLIAYELLQLIGAVPILQVSTHMVILKKVALTFLKSIVIFSIPLIAFSMSFFVLFSAPKEIKKNVTTTVTDGTNMCCNKDDDEDEFNSFGDLGISLIKTFVMMTGEFDASALKLDQHPFISLTFVVYVFFGFMVIFNLLNAFAVDDTQVIKSEGELVDLCQRIKELSKYEKISSGWQAFNSYITILIETIPEARIILRSNHRHKVLTYRASRGRGELAHDMKIEMQDARPLNGTDESQKLTEKYFSMDSKIIKSARNLLQQKKESKNAKEREEILMKQIETINLKLNTVMAEFMKKK